MNMYVSQKIIDRWPSHEFRGKPRKSVRGFTYMEAHHKILNDTYFYVFGADSFVDKEGILAGAPELIFYDLESIIS